MKRTLSGVERMMYLLSERTSVNAVIWVRIQGPLDEAKLRLALDRLSRRHPMLSTRVVREQGVLAFTTEAAPPIPLRLVSDDGSGQSILQVATAEVVTPLARSTGPLTRFTLVRHPDGEQADLLMTADHTIADGTAYLYAIRDLLAFHEAPDIEIDAAPPLVPPPNAGPPATPLSSVSTSDIVVVPATLGREPMQALARRCREQGVTVHAAVCAAFGASFAALSETKPKIIISSPVSYRHRLDPGVRDTVSCSVAFADLHVNVSPPGSFWEQAHAVRQQLQEWTTDKKLFGSSLAIEEASQAEHDDASFLHRIHREKSHDFSITNLGRLPMSSRCGDLTIESIHGISCLPGEIVVALGTLDETMHITLATIDLSSAETDAARRMLEAALARLSTLPA